MTDQSSTPAIAALEAADVPFRVVRTEIAHSAEESAALQGTSRLTLPDADEARAETGYERGAITPFGALRASWTSPGRGAVRPLTGAR